jgi:hypothetical protein
VLSEEGSVKPEAIEAGPKGNDIIVEQVRRLPVCHIRFLWLPFFH